jgi:hypothetical protein
MFLIIDDSIESYDKYIATCLDFNVDVEQKFGKYSTYKKIFYNIYSEFEYSKLLLHFNKKKDGVIGYYDTNWCKFDESRDEIFDKFIIQQRKEKLNKLDEI